MIEKGKTSKNREEMELEKKQTKLKQQIDSLTARLEDTKNRRRSQQLQNDILLDMLA